MQGADFLLRFVIGRYFQLQLVHILRMSFLVCLSKMAVHGHQQTSHHHVSLLQQQSMETFKTVTRWYSLGSDLESVTF